MKNSFYTTKKCLLALSVLAGLTGFSQTLTPEFQSAGYTLIDLGSINQLPPRYGGLTIRADQPNTLYIGGDANTGAGALYTVALLRDPVNSHITGFEGDAVLYKEAPNNDGGLFFAPNGTLLFTRYSMNHLGQILPDNTYITTLLTDYGISSSVGSIALVPSGYPGAGNLIIASYNAAILYNIPYTIDGSGQYILSYKTAEVSVSPDINGPEGIAYIPAGSIGFPNLSMAISSYGNGKVVVCEVGGDGLPVVSSARDMITGLSGAEGALIDPVTGDFLFSTYGGGDKIIRVSGFQAPSGIGDKQQKNSTDFSIFPNPTSGLINIELTDHLVSGSFEICDIFGNRIIRKEIYRNGIYELDLTSQPDGIYVIRITNGEKVGAQRFIKY
jgi:hypothetical protein